MQLFSADAIELIFHIMKSRDQTSVLLSVLATLPHYHARDENKCFRLQSSIQEQEDEVNIVEAECNIDSDCADIENSLCTVGGKCECLEGFLSTYDVDNPTKV